MIKVKDREQVPGVDVDGRGGSKSAFDIREV